jgi:hypothetical protein
MTRLFSYLILIIAIVGFSHSAHAGPIYYTATLNGLSESQANASPGTGFAEVIVDSILQTMSVDVTFSDLVGTTTAAHIHAVTSAAGTGTTGVATPLTSFPLGVTSGLYSHTFDTTLASTYNTAFVTANGGSVVGAETALFSAISTGKAYLNIHTNVFPGGEIRGFLVPRTVPEPAINILMTLGVLGFLFAKQRAVSLTS